MKPSLYAVLAALALGSIAVQAKDASAPKMAVKALSGVPAAELPAAAAKAVTQAPKDAQVATVEAVIRKIGRTNPAALRLVVAALAKEDPSLAAIAAGAAAKSNPESVALFAAAACGAAPQKAHEVIAVCARGSALDRTSLSDMVATIEPSYAADALSVEGEAIDTSSSAAVIRGGTVIAPRPIPGQVGITMNGEAVTVAPTAIGPGRPGFDPDRYARGGN